MVESKFEQLTLHLISHFLQVIGDLDEDIIDFYFSVCGSNEPPSHGWASDDGIGPAPIITVGQPGET